jgi:hypothetical protein
MVYVSDKSKHSILNLQVIKWANNLVKPFGGHVRIDFCGFGAFVS